MSNPYVQLAAYLASLAACSVLVGMGRLDPHMLTFVLGVGMPGPGSALLQTWRTRSNPPPPMPGAH